MARKHLLWIWKFQCYSDRIDGMQRQELEVLERMMGNENTNQMNFFSEMSEYQITAREFFSTVSRHLNTLQIGRASCRERVSCYV